MQKKKEKKQFSFVLNKKKTIFNKHDADEYRT